MAGALVRQGNCQQKPELEGRQWTGRRAKIREVERDNQRHHGKQSSREQRLVREERKRSGRGQRGEKDAKRMEVGEAATHA
jgi:hypothetical protein